MGGLVRRRKNFVVRSSPRRVEGRERRFVTHRKITLFGHCPKRGILANGAPSPSELGFRVTKTKPEAGAEDSSSALSQFTVPLATALN